MRAEVAALVVRPGAERRIHSSRVDPAASVKPELCAGDDAYARPMAFARRTTLPRADRARHVARSGSHECVHLADPRAGLVVGNRVLGVVPLLGDAAHGAGPRAGLRGS